MEVATSRCVLSAVRWATDINYRFIVLLGGCSDGDSEVHLVLTEKVYLRQGTVMSTQELLVSI